jgi:hypothetical protein
VTHNNSSKEIGTAWEVAVRDHLRHVHGFGTVERLPLAGRRDVGDLGGLPDFLIGCKSEKTIRLSTYMDELQAQKANLPYYSGHDVVPIEIVKRRGKGPGRAYVVVELDEFVPVMRQLTSESGWIGGI